MAETLTGMRDVAVLSLLLGTGIRIGELCRLTLDDVYMESYIVLVHGKGNKQRSLRFGDGSRAGGKVALRLRDYLKTRRTPHGKTEAFFLSQSARPLTTGGYYAAFHKACARAGITAGTEVHRTRHTFATHYLVSHPGDVEGLRYMLGHMSDDEYRTYAGEAGRLLAEIAGDDVGAADLLEREPPAAATLKKTRRPQTTLPPKREPRRLRPVPDGRAPAKRQPSMSVESLQALIAAVKTDPELRSALLDALRGVWHERRFSGRIETGHATRRDSHGGNGGARVAFQARAGPRI